jgi:serine protease Do
MRIVRALGVLIVFVAVIAVVVGLAPALRGQSSPGDRTRVMTIPDLFDEVEIGASVRDVDQADASREKLGSNAGAVVDDVSSDGPAATAGLKTGDVITEFDGEHVRSARHLIRLVRESRDNQPVKMVVMRDGKRTDLTITPRNWRGRTRTFTFDDRGLHDSLRGLSENLPRNFSFNFDGMGRLSARGRLGVSVQELTPQLADFFGVKDGVLVTAVTEGTPASKAGLKAGDIITAVEGRSVASVRDLTTELQEVTAGKEISVSVTRDRKALTLKATLEDRPTTRVRGVRRAA